MNWTTETTPSGATLHTTQLLVTDDSVIQTAVMEAADYAFSLLSDSILDDSMYCLFDWQSETGAFTISVTDQSKSHDGKHQIKLVCQGASASDELAEDIKYWIKDHLTTSLGFLQFSLIAGFTRGSREKIELL